MEQKSSHLWHLSQSPKKGFTNFQKCLAQSLSTETFRTDLLLCNLSSWQTHCDTTPLHLSICIKVSETSINKFKYEKIHICLIFQNVSKTNPDSATLITLYATHVQLSAHLCICFKVPKKGVCWWGWGWTESTESAAILHVTHIATLFCFCFLSHDTVHTTRHKSKWCLTRHNTVNQRSVCGAEGVTKNTITYTT